MGELYRALVLFMKNNSSASIGQVFDHFSTLGYSKQEIGQALRKFSTEYIEKTTDECN